ncbi:hypothetical protein ACUXCC_004199 [Cytobacillus horneckiae]|nr:hypothetical protein [Cytobacillus horneckiae]MEC1157927.1 hypothetical protein [Cytobacillus horneckiae]MED2937148.1 hypothetical protein [Cytobacillus horneckiae]
MIDRRNKVLKYSILFKKMGVLSEHDLKQIMNVNKIVVKSESERG